MYFHGAVYKAYNEIMAFVLSTTDIWYAHSVCVCVRAY